MLKRITNWYANTTIAKQKATIRKYAGKDYFWALRITMLSQITFFITGPTYIAVHVFGNMTLTIDETSTYWDILWLLPYIGNSFFISGVVMILGIIWYAKCRIVMFKNAYGAGASRADLNMMHSGSVKL